MASDKVFKNLFGLEVRMAELQTIQTNKAPILEYRDQGLRRAIQWAQMLMEVLISALLGLLR